MTATLNVCAELAPLLTVSDLERVLKVNKRTISRLCHSGTLPPPLKVGQGNRWRADAIKTALEQLEHQGVAN